MLNFLKLGGSLITDKTKPFTAKPERMKAIASEIAMALRSDPSMKLVLGHGSGSFGHTPASTYQTRSGVTSPEQWRGFSEVWYQASRLNRILMDSLHEAGIPAVTISPLSAVTTHAGKPLVWDTYPVQSALQNGLLPVIHGDVVFDDERGGTILSTEELFYFLALQLHPSRIFLAGLEEGVFHDFKLKDFILSDLTPEQKELITAGGSATTDVTGGMRTKIEILLGLIEQDPELEAFIFSGVKPGVIKSTLMGGTAGTHLHR